MMLLFSLGLDVSGVVYWALVPALGGAAAMQFAEASHAITPPTLPSAPTRATPLATAIVTAYLPNEAETIVETLEHVLSQKYSGGLQVILAYNTPKPHPVEAELRTLAAANPSLTLLPTPNSTPKAQNVNAALGAVDGEFVGIFDADNHPMAGAFEQIYAVSHPGRQMLHGFGIFGESNGFWRASVLREIRMRGLFLTEDIEASIRSVREGRGPGASLRVQQAPSSPPGVVSPGDS